MHMYFHENVIIKFPKKVRKVKLIFNNFVLYEYIIVASRRTHVVDRDSETQALINDCMDVSNIHRPRNMTLNTPVKA